MDQGTKSLIYVGDMAQQTQLGTIKSWQEINEFIEPTRRVVLQKVYRNTEYILKYIKSLGYDIQVTDGVKKGVPVMEKVLADKERELNYVEELAKGSKNVMSL